MWVRESDCCSAGVADDSDICLACKEHCDVNEYYEEEEEGDDEV